MRTAESGAPDVAAAKRPRFTGAYADLGTADRAALLDRKASGDDDVGAETAAIIDDVRRRGNAALTDLARRYDRVALEAIEVPRSLALRAFESLDPVLRSAMERSARNIEAVHRAFAAPRPPTEIEPEPGIVVGRRADPLSRVGIYAPGGRASYPSSVLMAAIPARVAGVGEVILCSPPGPDGLPASTTLAAAAMSGVDRIFALGGAGAVAAMAFGTETVPRVDKIVGPGNAYVAAAKLQLVGEVAIDSPAGPSELLVIADDTASPAAIAAEMVAQAEHDPSACVVAAVLSGGAAEELEREVLRQTGLAPRREVIEAALAARGAILVFGSLDDAVRFGNDYAPEHLLLAVESPDTLLQSVRNAGSVFLGQTSSVAFGDYMTGANHVLPTGGLARAYSGLSTLDFVRWTTYQRVAPAAAARLAADVGVFADAEGLPSHAASARQWEEPR